MAGKRRVAVKINLELPYRCNVDPFAGCQEYADEAGWDCVINPFADRALERGHAAGPFDGVLARATRPLVEAAERSGVPVVNIAVDSPVRDLPSVLPDPERGGMMAAEHLVARGFRQFGFLGYKRNIFSKLQHRGFHSVLGRGGFPCTDYRFGISSCVASAAGWDAFIAGMEAWVGTWKPPIGIYVVEDLVCRYLIEVCRLKGLNVPQDVSIVGSDDDVMICTAQSPTLTSIDLGYRSVGYRAAALLDRLMDGEPPPAEPDLVPPVALVPRQSTDSYAVDDPVVRQALLFIAEHSHKPMRVNDVAAAVAATRRSLERRFRESMNRSIAEEISRLRVERAKRRLVETDESLKLVAEAAGFSDTNHFYKVFMRIEGTSPTKYRDLHR